MSVSLKEKTDELVRAKEELEKLNRNLENRVEARTRELKAAQDELIKKERLAAIGQMASVVGHEIRNPLAVINNSIYYVKTKLSANGVEVDAKIGKHISIIESEIQQANGIISEILTFARTRELKPEIKSLNLFLEDILSTYPFPGNIQVLKEFCTEDPMVMIDPEEMKQALRNIIGNAIEAMTAGGVLKAATLIVSPQDWVRIDISDTGPGIPKDVRERIFTPFYTTKARGTGLGLAVVKKVIDRHKGKVDVASEVGQGTTFQLYLPQASRLSPTSGLRSGN
jgi:signal transduction histidine kinase